MKCPKCSADNLKVIDSRPAKGNTTVYRRRRCPDCGHRFTTYEGEVITRTDVMSPYPIETNIPVPVGSRCGVWKEQLSAMREGDSFFIPSEGSSRRMKTLRSNIYHSAYSRGFKIKTRITNKGVRVWLIKGQ